MLGEAFSGQDGWGGGREIGWFGRRFFLGAGVRQRHENQRGEKDDQFMHKGIGWSIVIGSMKSGSRKGGNHKSRKTGSNGI